MADFWIQKYCYRSDPGGRLILFEDSDRSFKNAGGMLRDDLKNLEALLKRQKDS